MFSLKGCDRTKSRALSTLFDQLHARPLTATLDRERVITRARLITRKHYYPPPPRASPSLTLSPAASRPIGSVGKEAQQATRNAKHALSTMKRSREGHNKGQANNKKALLSSTPPRLTIFDLVPGSLEAYWQCKQRSTAGDAKRETRPLDDEARDPSVHRSHRTFCLRI
jgi:hypothetical protein